MHRPSHLNHVLYSIAMMQQEFAAAGQELHPAKSQMLASEECEEASLWSEDEMHQHIATGGARAPPFQQTRCINIVSATTVLGSSISVSAPKEVPIAARCKAAWLAYSRMKGQLVHKSTTLGVRVRLLDVMVMPSAIRRYNGSTSAESSAPCSRGWFRCHAGPPKAGAIFASAGLDWCRR